MGSPSSNTSNTGSGSSVGESVIVVMDANRDKGSLDALDWAIKYIVGPKDTVVALGLLPELGKKTTPTCFPFHMGIGTSRSWVKLEFSGQGETTPTELQEEIERKRVKLEIKLAAGLDPRKITVDEAQNCDPRWIALDSYLKKDKDHIHEHVACHVAFMKAKGVATVMPSKVKGPECEQWQTVCKRIDDYAFTAVEVAKYEDEVYNNTSPARDTKPSLTPQSPGWYPLSWRTGFPRAFSVGELAVITNGFANESIVVEKHDRKIYQGFYQETLILILSFPGNDEKTCSLLKILSRVCHRSILNLVGYCCKGDSMFLLCDCPGSGTLEMFLQCNVSHLFPHLKGLIFPFSFHSNRSISIKINWTKDLKFVGDELAKNVSWKTRWYTALEIGVGVRYLHEEGADGPIVDLSLCSANVTFSQGSSPMLILYRTTAKWMKNDILSDESLPMPEHKGGSVPWG